MIDLHLHTTCSDGEYSPEGLVDLAAKVGLSVMSITDHDTVSAYDTDIVSYASDRGIRMITGIEFSTIDELSGEKIHVLGFGFDSDNEELRKVCRIIATARREMVIKTDKKLLEIGVILRSQRLLDSESIITKTQIASDVISNPSNEQYFMEKYGEIPLQSVFIEDHLIKNKPAHILMDKNLSTSMAIDIIKKSGGRAICAHPSFNVMRGYDFDKMKNLILRNNFDGIEAINIQYDKRNGDRRFDMVDEFIQFANSHELLISGGSDFHSDIDPKLGNFSNIGMTNEIHKVTHDHLNKILNTVQSI